MNRFNLGYADLKRNSLWHRIKADLRRQARTPACLGDYVIFAVCVGVGLIFWWLL